MRIGIVNHVELARVALKTAISATPGLEVAWVVNDGLEALENCKRDTPNLILMDLFMPVMGGVEATRHIMAECPCAILIVTSSVDDHADVVFEAMGAGALDAVSMPVLSQSQLDNHEFIHKIRTISRLLNMTQVAPVRSSASPSDRWLLAIGSSTGGPNALATILGRLPKDFAAAVAIVQHVDATFAEGLGDWLNNSCALPVRVAHEGDVLSAGTVLVAGTNNHMVYTRRQQLSYTQDPMSLVYRPSVDVFFSSLAQHWPGNTIAVLLTGMGRDGAEGLLKLRRKGAYTIAQNKETCAVYGMPKAAVELDAASVILPIDEIAQAIMRHITSQENLVKRNTAV